MQGRKCGKEKEMGRRNSEKQMRVKILHVLICDERREVLSSCFQSVLSKPERMQCPLHDPECTSMEMKNATGKNFKESHP